MNDEDAAEKTPAASPQAKRSSGEIHITDPACPKCDGIGQLLTGPVCDLCMGKGQVRMSVATDWILTQGQPKKP